VQVHYGKGVAIHIGPEPCAGVRKGAGEAAARRDADSRIGAGASVEARDRQFSYDVSLTMLSAALAC
jgi:hypothetical protein